MTAISEPHTTTDGASLRNVTVQFEDRNSGAINTVLDNVNLNVSESEFVSLVGRSGCGKTTMLNVLAGLIEPMSGHVQVAGLEPRKARTKTGYMFARDALLPWRTAKGNVEYGMELHRKISRAQRHDQAQDYLERVHMGHAAKLWPWQLSQGMRQRVALARTWALEPKVLLMDEPFAALDAQTRKSVHQEFLAGWEAGKQAVVFVTHDLTEALELSDRVLVLGQGGSIIDDIKVPFERPRDFELSTTSEFQELRRHLIARIY